MAKKKAVQSVKLPEETHRLLKTVCSWKGEEVSKYLTELIHPLLLKEFQKMTREGAKLPPPKDADHA